MKLTLFKTVMTKHWLGIIFSLIVGIILVAPNLAFVNSPKYQGYPFMNTDAETWYISRINGVYKNCYLKCNPYIKESTSRSPFFDLSVSEPILAMPGIIFHVPVPALKVFYEFLLPTILSILIYFLVYRLTNSVLLGLLGISFITLGSNLINVNDIINFTDLKYLFSLDTPYTQFLLHSRPVNPQFSSIIFLTYLHILLSVVERRKHSLYLLALVYGLSFYIYFYTFFFVSVANFVYIVYLFFQKDWIEFKRIILAVFCGFVIGIPVLINIFQFIHDSLYQSSTIETFLVHTHSPFFGLIGFLYLFISIIIFYLIFRKKEKREHYIFFLILFLACFLIPQQHIFTGVTIQYNHFESYFFTPIFAIFICFVLNILLISKLIPQYTKYLLIIALFILILNASLIQIKSYENWLPISINNQKYMPVLNFLNKIIPSGSIVSAPEEVSSLITIFTSDYVLWANDASHWIHLPERLNDIQKSRSSLAELLATGQKYGVDYYVEERKNNLFTTSDFEKNKVYDDKDFIVYKASQ